MGKCDTCGSEDIYTGPVPHYLWLKIHQEMNGHIFCEKCLREAIAKIKADKKECDL